MRKIPVLSLLIILYFFLQSCIWGGSDDPPQVFVNPYTPVILDRTAFENSVESQPARTVTYSGKIYIKDNLMFINEKNIGFHVYQYSDPENPVNIGFIQIKGATDLAIRNGNIYINQAVDLVTLTYNEADNSIIVKHRNKNVFPQKVSPNGFIANTSENQIIVNWTLN
jgi:hypothetical protein